MADRLKALGYATGLIGKWHLGVSASRWLFGWATGSLSKRKVQGPRSSRVGAATASGAHLYNLAKDAGEQTNLADHEPEKVKQLTTVWTKWNSELEEPRWTPNRGSRNRNR